MTPESLSREGSPAPAQEITLHTSPPEEAPQIVASHLEIKTSSFTPGRKWKQCWVTNYQPLNPLLVLSGLQPPPAPLPPGLNLVSSSSGVTTIGHPRVIVATAQQQPRLLVPAQGAVTLISSSNGANCVPGAVPPVAAMVEAAPGGGQAVVKQEGGNFPLEVAQEVEITECPIPEEPKFQISVKQVPWNNTWY